MSNKIFIGNFDFAFGSKSPDDLPTPSGVPLIAPKLRALGDKKAIPALHGARNRIRTEGRLNRKVNTNACLRTAADEAIRYLESL